MVVPIAVRTVVEAWIGRERPEHPGTEWPRADWIRHFPEHEARWRALPERLARSAVRAECRNADASREETVWAFLVAMAWGHGVNGYGRYRTQRIITINRNAADALFAVSQSLRKDGPLSAYRKMANPGEGRLRYLGPAFGTKFLAFCSDATRPALILDEVVSSWFLANLQSRLVHGRWHPSSYEKYLESASAWASELGVCADDVEYCIFADEYTKRNGSEWGL